MPMYFSAIVSKSREDIALNGIGDRAPFHFERTHGREREKEEFVFVVIAKENYMMMLTVWGQCRTDTHTHKYCILFSNRLV